MKDQEIIEALQGTGDSISSLGEKAEARFDDADFCKLLDNQIFQCVDCAWWCPIDEEASADYELDELTCRDCCEGLT